MIDLYKGDCLEVMDELIAKGIVVDAIITDPPYGTTACKWDSVIPMNDWIELNGKKFYSYEDFIEYCYKNTKMSFKEVKLLWNTKKQGGMWERLNKLIKPNGAIVLFGSEPFSSALRMSNIKNYKYDWVWEKTQATGHLNAKKQPLRSNENISVFYSKQCTYNPQKTQGHKPMNSGVRKLSIQNKTEVYGKATQELPFGGGTDRLPRTNIVFKSDKQTDYQHSTQKPLKLMEYLCLTYTNENELVLDFTMGSGTTGVACRDLGRDFIGIELDDKYFEIAQDRIYDL